VDSAQQIIAEVGAQAATFPSAKNLVSWVGACPEDEESAGVNRSKRSPKGNRQMRRILYQAANAAVKHKGSIFEIVYRRLVLRLGHSKTIGAIAHRLCQLIWIILHNGVRYEERGPAVSEKSKRLRTTRMIRTLRNLGYRVEPLGNPARGIRFSSLLMTFTKVYCHGIESVKAKLRDFVIHGGTVSSVSRRAADCTRMRGKPEVVRVVWHICRLS
jgi:Transposase IS116/IS110/IS902 family